MSPPAPRSFLQPLPRFRPAKTLADYAAIAVCPILIMLVVGTFVFFLIEIGYAGSHLAKLRWTLFWFVLAMVLVSRIAIEKGYDHAGIYGLGLAAATAFVLTQYIDNYLGAWCILGLIWWATNKLTWDCTVIDEEADASGEGLLQAAKLDIPRAASAVPAGDTPDGTAPTNPDGHARSASAKPPWWKLLYRPKPKAATEPHAPGLWVIYFSLAALPIFGLGQSLLPSSDPAARARAFLFVVVYLASALGLLLLTSFLGLRRYLRQRQLVMPPAVSAAWISLGSTLGLAILVTCILLPRPNATWSFGSLMDRFGDPRSRSTRESTNSYFAEKANPQSETAGEQPGATPDDRARQVATSRDDTAGEKPAAGRTGGGENHPSGNPSVSGGRVSGPGGQAVQPRPSPAPASRLTLNWPKSAAYAVLLALLLFLLIKNRHHLAVLIQTLWRALQDFWHGLFASKPSASVQSVPVPRRSAPRPFAAFSNPFSSGQASAMPARDLIIYTFEALEAWAEGCGCGRQPEQTPFEFACRVGEQFPDCDPEVGQVGRLYAQVAYAGAAPPPCGDVLERLWSKLTHDSAAYPFLAR